MAHPYRFNPPDGLVEVTCRTVQGRALLRPDPELDRRILGVIGRAQRREGMEIHGIVVLSTHYHLLLSPQETDQLVRFMRYVQANIAKEVGDHRRWEGRIWARRYRSIPVATDDESQIDRLRYLLANSVKEGLVSSPRRWPGIHCARALLGEKTLEGVWYDRTALYERRRRGEKIGLADVAERETVHLSPLPCWRGLPEAEQRQQVLGLVEAIEEESRERHGRRGEHHDRRDRRSRRAIRNRNPRRRSPRRSRSPAPRFHARNREARRQLREAYQQFAERFQEARKAMKSGHPRPRFPPGSFPPGLPYVPHRRPG